VLAAQVHPAMQRTHFDCTITKIVIRNVPEPRTSEQQRGKITFWVDDGDKSLMFADGARLRITRFDQSWISGDRDDIRYEFDRSDGTLSFAGTTSEGTVTTTVLGSGNCEGGDKT
jgi:hypothetical protein